MTDITKYDPFRILWPKWLDEFDEPHYQKGLRVNETKENLVVEAVVAGVPAEKIDVDIEDGVLTIKAELKEEEKNEDGRKMTSRRYYYTTALSGGQWDKAEAEIQDGVVVVTIPKTKAARPKKISVKPKAK